MAFVIAMHARAQDVHKIHIYFSFTKLIIDIEIHKMQARRQQTVARQPVPRWVDLLEDEDLSFIKRFVLASGSLKDLASVYGISYPTIRLRLDRLIEKVKLLDRQDITSPFERTLRLQHAEGKIDRQTLKLLLDAHQTEIAHDRNEREGSTK
ncbi:MAG: DUF2089 domain-containing protein [Acidobacteriota bacterium]|nr:DUF2089 domain-containing protein [Acidobacteriota bacterium]